MRTYLIIEDDISHQIVWNAAIKLLDPTAQMIWAENLCEAFKAFRDNKEDLVFIAMDGCLNEEGLPDTLELTEHIRRSKWNGLMVGTSSRLDLHPRQIEAGCDQAFFKEKLIPAMREFALHATAV